MKKPTLKEMQKKIRARKFVDRDGIPHCPECGKKMVNAYDSMNNKISKYLWKTNCEHAKGLVLSMG